MESNHATPRKPGHTTPPKSGWFKLIVDGVRSPELISIEAHLRRNRDQYVDALQTTLGPSYDPDNHPVTD
jgi:hypothetical protein